MHALRIIILAKPKHIRADKLVATQETMLSAMLSAGGVANMLEFVSIGRYNEISFGHFHVYDAQLGEAIS